MSRRQKRLVAELGTFMRQYGRQSQAGCEPNDRRYDRKFERTVKRMDPLELDALLRVDDEPEGTDEFRR